MIFRLCLYTAKSGQKNHNKNTIFIMVFFIFICANIFCETTQSTYIHFIDVGQAESILIDCGGFEILIDGGNNSDGDRVSDYLSGKVDGNLEIMIATHPDADHIGGLDTVLENYTVDLIIDSGKTHTTKTYEDYMEAVKNENTALFIEDGDMVFQIAENVFFSVIELVDNERDNNSNSVVCQLQVGEISFLFTGDLESEIEIEYLEKFSEIDVLKVGHHGSATSTSREFLHTLNPRYAVISCGVDNRYGHPSSQTLSRLYEKNIFIYRTDLQGNIIAKTDGSSVLFNVYPSDQEQSILPEISKNATIENTVYVTRTGSKYHVYDCSYVATGSIEITIADAIKEYDPCSRCY